MRTRLYWIVLAVTLAAGQQPPAAPPEGKKVEPKTPYDSTKAQLMYVKQKNLQLQAEQLTHAYQAQMATLQQKFKDQDAALAAWVAEVRKTNGWDDTYVYDGEKDQWVQKEKPPAK